MVWWPFRHLRGVARSSVSEGIRFNDCRLVPLVNSFVLIAIVVCRQSSRSSDPRLSYKSKTSPDQDQTVLGANHNLFDHVLDTHVVLAGKLCFYSCLVLSHVCVISVTCSVTI